MSDVTSTKRAATTLTRARVRPRTWAEARLWLLRGRRVSLADIARDLRKDLSTVSRVNRGERRSHVIEEAIARRLDLPVPDAFPEWHRGDHKPPEIQPRRRGAEGRTVARRRRTP